MNDKTDAIFCEVFDDMFSKSDWDDWAKGEVNLFDLYMAKKGVSKKDAQKIREKYESPKKDMYKDFIENPVVASKTQKNK
tara:strand:- start:39 stop:278 length:240 start_codon:yes stop_codon:yes gene_type:complete